MIRYDVVTPRPVFASVSEAKRALMADRLGTVYWRGDQVYVVTAYGSGCFSREEWGDAEGQRARACGSLGRMPA